MIETFYDYHISTYMVIKMDFISHFMLVVVFHHFSLKQNDASFMLLEDSWPTSHKYNFNRNIS